ncbi:hypothetical protein ACFSC4_15135 [Deinococcus malanensis]|uniref:hypothetical protein n=1 Tax=Deinococcus malanensis TaxID=1706855 RepID=UPI00363CBD9E
MGSHTALCQQGHTAPGPDFLERDLGLSLATADSHEQIGLGAVPVKKPAGLVGGNPAAAHVAENGGLGLAGVDLLFDTVEKRDQGRAELTVLLLAAMPAAGTVQDLTIGCSVTLPFWIFCSLVLRISLKGWDLPDWAACAGTARASVRRGSK